MAKVVGSYPNVVRGVSQQTASQRLDGQHEEQINMISDPVKGLTRRTGSVLLGQFTPIGISTNPAYNDYYKTYGTFDFRIDGQEYTMFYPTEEAPSDLDLDGVGIYVYNKTKNSVIASRIVLDDLDTQMMLSNGVAKVTKAGDYLIIAAKDYITTHSKEVDVIATNPTNAYVWIKIGAYSRNYMVSVQMEGKPSVDVAYKTPSSAYPGDLDISDLSYDDPKYQLKVTNLLNEYNVQVTKWIGTAAEQSSPKYIANTLGEALAAEGLQVKYSEGSVIVITNSTITGISADDSSEGTHLQVAFEEVKDSTALLPYAMDGEVMRVRPDKKTDAYYMRADAESGASKGIPVKCTWRETTGMRVFPETLFIVGVLHDQELLLSAKPSLLRAASPDINVPDFGGRLAGDSETSALPKFLGNTIDYIGMFQDRLVVVHGSTISMSEVGNYFNFFRQTALTVLDNDPVEAYASGADDDTIKHSVIFDRSMLLFGERQQYTVDGRVPITPATTTVIQSSVHYDAVDAAPITRGSNVFFTQRSEGRTIVNQLVIGDVQDTSMVRDVSAQLSDYIKGTPVQLIGTASPDMIVVRTNNDYSKIFVLRYMDQERERLLESWCSFTYSPHLGPIVGMSLLDGQLLLYHLGFFGDRRMLLVCRQSLQTDPPKLPYLDALQPYYAVKETSGDALQGQEWLSCAVDVPAGEARLHGTDVAYNGGIFGKGFYSGAEEILSDYPEVTPEHIWSGVKYTSEVTLTSPFLRDSNGVAITTGRFTVTNIDVTFAMSSGFVATMKADGVSTIALDTSGRIQDTASSTYAIPIEDGTEPVFIGRESRNYTMNIRARDWLPLTIVALEWTGQAFSSGSRR